MRRAPRACACLALLLALAWAGRAQTASSASQVPRLDALAAPPAAASAQPPGAAAEAQRRQLVPSRRFQHPLAPPEQLHSRLVEAAAHADMEAWLAGFFNSSAAQLTSTRLREGRAAKAAASQAAGPTQPAGQGAHAGAMVEVAATPVEGQACAAACLRQAAREVLLAREQSGGVAQLRWQPFAEDRGRWASPAPAPGSSRFVAARGGQPGGDACTLRRPGEPIAHDFLIVAAVGNKWDTVNGWLSQPESATFDVVLLHYGNDTSLRCPACAAVIPAAGPKWTLVWRLMQQPGWAELAAGKRAVMVADDDVVMSTCSINRAFEVFDAYGLLLGQPSLCPTRHRPSWYLHLVRDDAQLLRFVTMVEIMAPMFEMDFFQRFVRPSLHDAYTGWGLDFVWPFLLQYPRDRVAVIDDVCMLHPHQAQQKKGEGSIYAALAKVAPYDAREEEARRDAQFGYYPSEVGALGFGYRPLQVLGSVPKQRGAGQVEDEQRQGGGVVLVGDHPPAEQRPAAAPLANKTQPPPPPQTAASPQSPQPPASPSTAPRGAAHVPTPQAHLQQQQHRALPWDGDKRQALQQAHPAAALQPPQPDASIAFDAAASLSGRRRMHPWLLCAQVAVMAWTLGMLLLWGSKGRRPSSPRPAPLLPGHLKSPKPGQQSPARHHIEPN